MGNEEEFTQQYTQGVKTEPEVKQMLIPSHRDLNNVSFRFCCTMTKALSHVKYSTTLPEDSIQFKNAAFRHALNSEMYLNISTYSSQ